MNPIDMSNSDKARARRLAWMGGSAVGALLMVLAFTAWMHPGSFEPPAATTSAAATPPATQPRGLSVREAAVQYLQFEPNRGQAPKAVRYLSRGPSHSVEVFDDGLALSATRSADRTAGAAPGAPAAARAQLRFVGAGRGGAFEARELAPGQTSYLLGEDASRWIRGVPRYRQLRRAELYPGIDLVYYSRQGELEFDLVVKPGADASRIRLQVGGAKAPVIAADGDLLLDGAGGVLRLHRPVLYQNIAGERRVLDAHYVLHGERELSFLLPAYDKRYPLVIDPVFKLLYSTYLGGVHDDQVGGMVLDANSNAYVIGHSGSEDWPVSGNAYQTARKAIGSYVRNVVVTKFDASGTLVYSTFIGGRTNDYGSAIAVDAAGRAYLTGNTTSSDFPVTAGAYQPTFKGSPSAYLAILSPDGSALSYSTFYGGSGAAQGLAIALDASGAPVLAGSAGPGLSTTAGAYKTTLATGNAAFVARFSPLAGGPPQLAAASYYGVDNPQANGTSQGNSVLAMALDANGAPWFTGQAFTTNLPLTAGALQAAPTAMSPSCAPGAVPLSSFAYVAKLSADLGSLVYASYLSGSTEPAGGTSCSEFGRAIAVDAAGNVYLTGGTASDKFPTTAGALQPTLPTGTGFGSYSSFVAKLKADGSAILWSTYFGGNVGSTFPGGSLVVDARANTVWMSAMTGGGSNYPISADALQAVYGGGTSDASIAGFDASSGALKHSTFVGGSGADIGLALAVDAAGTAFVAGTTTSTNFPVSPTAFQPALTANAYDGSDWFFSVLGSGTIGSVLPARGGNNGSVTLSVRGAGFQAGAVGALIGSNGAVLASATALNRAADGSSADFVFLLDSAAPGSYDLRITNPDATVFTKSAAYAVVAGGTPALSVQVLGRPKIRTGVASTFQVIVSNSGSVDAYMVPLWITVPNTVSVSIDGLNVAAGATWFADTGVNRFPQFIPVVRAGGSETVSMTLTAPVDIASIDIKAALQAPWLRSAAAVAAFVASPTSDAACVPDPTNPYFSNCAGLYFAYLGAHKTPFALSGATTASESRAATLAALKHRLDGGNCPTPPPPDAPGFLDGVTAGSKDRASTPQGHTPNPWNGTGNNSAWAGWQAGYAAGWAAGGSTGSTGTSSNGPRERLLASCPPDPLPPPPPPVLPTGGGSTGAGGAIDPNDKIGPAGDGSAQHFVRAGLPFTYEVAFENQPTASLPAARVVITDALDPAKVDLSTLTLGPISFGSHTIAVPPGLQSYATTQAIDATISVRVQGSLDTSTGVVKWTFDTLDPATKLPPSDPTLGFLPPDTDGKKGQGYVTFTVAPKAGLADGTKISNQASIVFDANGAIATPVWSNTLDLSAPSSKIGALTPKVGTTSFDVSWSGSDAGSGVRTYTVYVSDGGAAFAPWLTQVSATTAAYAGTSGHTYAFYAIASDGAGNTEPAKTAAEASITVSGPFVDDTPGNGGGGGGGCTIGVGHQRDLSLPLLLLLAAGLWQRRRYRVRRRVQA